MSGAAPKVLDIIRTAADDCRVQGNTMASNELLEAAGMVRELLEELGKCIRVMNAAADRTKDATVANALYAQAELSAPAIAKATGAAS